MGYCTKCGTFLGDASGNCSSCQSSGHNIGTPEDVPCQRCGMYLPSHELQMWNSRLYCAYCIMDVKDEERMITERRAHAEAVPAGETVGQEHGKGSAKGICERCGRETAALYTLSGRRICEWCYAEESGSPPSPSGGSFLAQIVVQAQKIFGITPKGKMAPRLIVNRKPQAAQKIDAEGKKKEKNPFEGKKKD